MMQSASRSTRLFAIAILGTCAVARASDFSYEPYARVLAGYVNEQGLVDYTSLQAHRDDLDAFTRHLADLEPQTFAQWSQPEKLAFWINAYNALTLKAVVDHYPVKSIKDIGSVFVSVWDKLTFPVMGEELTLNHIEHEVLRKEFSEPRIHLAINCASVGCPPLLDIPWQADSLETQFVESAKAFLSDPSKFRIDQAAARVYLSPIFKWFGDDFMGNYGSDLELRGLSDKENAVIAFLATYTGPSDQAFLRAGPYRVKYLGYDWSLNESTP